MTEHHTFPGKTYCITCAEGCTVTDASGQLNEECAAGKQLWVTAPSEKLFTSAPASVRETFNSAPVKLRLLGLLGGGASTLPSGYLAAEFLESTGTQYCNVSYAVTFDTGLWGKYRNTGVLGENNESPLMTKRNNGTFMRVPHPNWKNASTNARMMATYKWEDYTANSVALGVYSGVIEGSINWETDLTQTTVASIVKIESGVVYRYANFSTTSWQTDGTVIELCHGVWAIYELKIAKGYDVKHHFIPVLDKNGIPCWFDRVSKQPFYNSGTGSFIVGMTLEQARKLGKLPSTGGELTVSLPWEAGVDAKVQAALAKAAENGWTVLVQYREPEVATENISVDFLEGTGTQWVESNAYLSKLHDFDLEIADLSGSQAWGREDGGFVLSMGIQSYGIRFIYANGGYKDVRLTQLSGRTLIQKRGNVFSMNGVSATADFSESTTVSTKPVRIFTYQGTAPYIAKGKWIRQTVYLNGETVQDVRMTLDVSGVPCMHDSVSGESFYNSGAGAFIAGFESTEKASLGLAKLPVVEAGDLTVSLPAAAQDEATRVPAAIEVARQRGWTIITQYRD